MNLREEFLKSVEEDSPETFLRFIEQHVSKVHSYLEDQIGYSMTRINLFTHVRLSKNPSISSLYVLWPFFNILEDL